MDFRQNERIRDLCSKVARQYRYTPGWNGSDCAASYRALRHHYEETVAMTLSALTEAIDVMAEDSKREAKRIVKETFKEVREARKKHCVRQPRCKGEDSTMKGRKTEKPVLEITDDESIVDCWMSLSDCSRDTGIPKTTLSYALNCNQGIVYSERRFAWG